MKGPQERRKYDLRRVWECPDCHHKERTGGDVTSMICPCQQNRESQNRHVMLLRDDGPRRIR